MTDCHVSIDRNRCSGIGVCEGNSPEFFEVDDDGRARVLTARIPADRFDELREVAAGCPTQSVIVELAD